jgi:hypothetical protein
MTDCSDERQARSFEEEVLRTPIEVPKRLTLRERLRRWVARGTNPQAKVRVVWACPPHLVNDDDDSGVPPTGA